MFMPTRPRLQTLAAGLAVVTASAFTPDASAMFDTSLIASDLSAPIYVTHAPGRTDQLFIVERGGDIKILNKDTGLVNATPFLSIPDINNTGEGALIGLAFHPDFETNGRFYVGLTTDPHVPGTSLTSRIREYTVTDLLGNPNVADATPKEILSIPQPQFTHNGGWVGFSPNPNDNYLYIMTGDGGGSNDDDAGHTDGSGNAQDITDNLLGKILRIDIDGDDFPADDTRNYAIPTGAGGAGDIANPFVGVTGDDEIWAYGLRNPFRASFDRLTGDLYVGDVGQGTREEINLQPANSTGGENYGWRLREGDIPNPSASVGGPVPPNNVDPLYDYEHGGTEFQGNSVTGGVLYRGPVAELQGQYLFGDFVSNNIWSLDPADPDNTVTRINDDLIPNASSINSIVAFGEDTIGNVYIVDISGEIFRIGLPGDLNADGFVGIDDMSLVLNNWNQGTPPVDIIGDLDSDGFVGINDLNIILAAWNQSVTLGDLMAGDPSEDGFVGIDDLNLVLGNWNAGNTPGGLIIGDANGDQFVGLDDLNIILGNWNTGTPPTHQSPIPEPTTAAFLLIGGATLLPGRYMARKGDKAVDKR